MLFELQVNKAHFSLAFRAKMKVLKGLLGISTGDGRLHGLEPSPPLPPFKYRVTASLVRTMHVLILY